ncbi:MAG: hypothetical protein KDA41_17905, partial [Planctomycetales bacterium]|nr:hypothetical protein [Planctomycetales bacterium]
LEDALAARGFVESPIAWLAAEDSLPRTKADNRAAQTIRFDSPHASPPPGLLLPLEIGGRRAAVAAGFAADGEEITARYGALPQPIDLCEPFERIREAITETQLRR